MIRKEEEKGSSSLRILQIQPFIDSMNVQDKKRQERFVTAANNWTAPTKNNKHKQENRNY